MLLLTGMEESLRTPESGRGEPLAVRARNCRDELAAAMDELPSRDLREREDLGVALGAIDRLLAHDLKHASSAVIGELERWLSSSRRYLDDLSARKRAAPR
ncbi:MAG: hypothetical protein KF773_19025 [Deltaproteobacteria bacterium]|nr:hypothetical protein [Deltaproteobacteria bacterium]MCW5802222.1 hypothetical protein [Deltaproteobacteria bacterium]